MPTCDLCDSEMTLDRWNSLLWAWQERHGVTVETVEARPIVNLCSVCAGVASQTIYAAVRKALAEINPKWIPHGVNHAQRKIQRAEESWPEPTVGWGRSHLVHLAAAEQLRGGK
jgi:hypothetical protein